jgi:hypothetical protein
VLITQAFRQRRGFAEKNKTRAGYLLKIKAAPLSLGSHIWHSPKQREAVCWLCGTYSASSVGAACLHPSPSTDTGSGPMNHITSVGGGRVGRSGVGERE